MTIETVDSETLNSRLVQHPLMLVSELNIVDLYGRIQSNDTKVHTLLVQDKEKI